MEFDAFDHFFENLDLSFDLISALRSLSQFVFELRRMLLLQLDNLLLQVFTFLDCQCVQTLQLLNSLRQLLNGLIRIFLHVHELVQPLLLLCKLSLELGNVAILLGHPCIQSCSFLLTVLQLLLELFLGPLNLSFPIKEHGLMIFL